MLLETARGVLPTTLDVGPHAVEDVEVVGAPVDRAVERDLLDVGRVVPIVRLNVNDEAVGVSKDFLEKQSIQWLSIAQVQESLHSEKLRQPYVFRNSFRQRMKVVLDQFEDEFAFEPPRKIFCRAVQKNRQWKQPPSLPYQAYKA